jgi:uncharacterized membrane protein
MKITPTFEGSTYAFNVEFRNKHYKVQIWMNESSTKFQDWEITDSHGNKIDFDTEDEIISEINEKWDSLTK